MLDFLWIMLFKRRNFERDYVRIPMQKPLSIEHVFRPFLSLKDIIFFVFLRAFLRLVGVYFGSPLLAID